MSSFRSGSSLGSRELTAVLCQVPAHHHSSLLCLLCTVGTGVAGREANEHHGSFRVLLPYFWLRKNYPIPRPGGI